MGRTSKESERRSALVELGRQDLTSFQEALANEKDAALSSLIDDLEGAKLYGAAELVYRVLITRKPRSASHHVNLGINLYYHQRDGLRAEAFLRDATLAFPDDDSLAATRGINLAWGLGRHQDALPEFERAVVCAPGNASNQVCLSWCALWLGDVARGLVHAQKALDGTVEQSQEVRLAAHLYRYLFTLGQTEGAARNTELCAVARLVKAGVQLEDWDVSELVRRAREAAHPEGPQLAELVRVSSGEAPATALETWPAWRRAQLGPDGDLLMKIAKVLEERSAAGVPVVSPEALYEAARAEALTVCGPRNAALPVDEAYPTPTALHTAILAGEERVAEVALIALARLDGERHVELLLEARVAHSRSLHFAAARGLTFSRNDRALASLVEGLEPNGEIGPFLIASSVHPRFDERARALLAAGNLLDFTPRPRPRVSAWNALGQAERAALKERSPVGARPREVVCAKQALIFLSLRRDPALHDLAAHIFKHHPDDWLRGESANALVRLDLPGAHAVLDEAWADAEPVIGTTAVRAAVERAPGGAWERFAPHIDAVLADKANVDDEVIVSRLLEVLQGGSGPSGKVSKDRHPLVAEPRFYALAAALRANPRFEHAARPILERLPRAELDALLNEHQLPTHTPPKAPAKSPIILPVRRDFVARYRGGEYQVWDELRRHASAIAAHADLREEATAVAALLMARVRQNRDTVRATLIAAGGSLRDEALPATTKDLARFIGTFGPLPVSLHVFWTVVGSIHLGPEWQEDEGPSYGACALEDEGISLVALDPLQVSAPDFGWELEEYEAERAEKHPELAPSSFSVPIAPDFLHKQNISGGSPYAIELPPSNAWEMLDPQVLDEGHDEPLVSYLRRAFSYGGFPLLEVAPRSLEDIALNDRVAFRDVKGSWKEPAERLRARLCKDLVLF